MKNRATAMTTTGAKDRISTRNLIMFPLGTIGRDFIYNLFNTYMMTYILLTKHLTAAELGAITFIVVAARIFDALNDPVMGGIVENTRTRWGKYKPWQLIGAVLTSGVVIALYTVNLDHWAFIGFLAVIYLLFSVTFTMNDISYWGMLPTLSSDNDSRNRLTSFAQIAVTIGGGAAGVLIPLLTTGQMGAAIFGSAKRAYAILSIISAALMIGFQLFTILGVKENPLPDNFIKTPRLKVKDIFGTILHNDQLLWSAVILLLYNVGTGVAGAGLVMMFLYFMFGYEGMYNTLFYAIMGLIGVVFTLFYPAFGRKWGRDKLLYSTAISIIVAYVLILIFGLCIPTTPGFDFNLLGIHLHLNLKYLLMATAFGFTGWGGGFYMIMTIYIANTVEYNEYKKGKREEGLIFSLRPLVNKLGSAISVGLVSVVYIIAGVLATTNKISDVENAFDKLGNLTAEQQADKLAQIQALIDDVPTRNKTIMLVCMCLIPIAFMTVAMILYRRFCFLNETKMEEIKAAIEARGHENSTDVPEGIALYAGDDADGDATACEEAPSACSAEIAASEDAPDGSGERRGTTDTDTDED